MKAATPTTHKSPAGAGTGARAMSLHIGLNGVSADAYAGWSGPLSACEYDANDMAALARSRGMAPVVLLTKKAGRAAVLAAVRDAAAKLAAGSLFFLSYSGHGGQVPDVTGEEDDKKDETWCLFDGQLIDDELYVELSRFRAGVRILVLSDSCHSGTVTRQQAAPPAPPGQRPKLLPEPVARRVYQEHQAFYDGLQREVARSAGAPVVDPDTAIARVAASRRLAAIAGQMDAAAILVSGCQDNQTSMDGEHNGAFTEQLLKVWDQGRFAGNHALFHARIRARMPASQSPNLFTLGAAGAFLAQTPFTV